MAHALFISHGSPLEAIDQSKSARAWQALAQSLPRPKRIVVASAHWSTTQVRLTGSASPETIHDFYGFPASLYRIRYPAPGDPQLANDVAECLNAGGVEAQVDHRRGLDHGMWAPLRHLYPDADIPVVGLSINARASAEWHYTLGQHLCEALDDDTLLIASGSITHNLTDAGNKAPSIAVYVEAFQQWVSSRLETRQDAELMNYRDLAPGARRAHPSEEHLLPLFVALGAADAAAPTRVNPVISEQALAMDAYLFTRRQGAAVLRHSA
ncbi:DODA-type extradiol aromatic ring-opening family dioxygenase [Larsenimonas suaedae]|uniref:Class III extradiol ring-cleavage dioxygenase n=1 Tax=Larsenimonas suaedae TaxID=1851019 RepID=A0ABU1GY46_9GAMM|nr:class III extradiol ring-cleavage dioxygenase [Larsenimonas suaedae]MCM2973370.1 dioxygenase [Larsenimonas suaedae]MDR5896263.1 class III extradiol ring-cleavage dioxygenase [Larsenimonas suaedae]